MENRMALRDPGASDPVPQCLELLKQGKAPDVGTALTQSLRSLPAEAEYLAANTVLFGCPFLAPK